MEAIFVSHEWCNDPKTELCQGMANPTGRRIKLSKNMINHRDVNLRLAMGSENKP